MKLRAAKALLPLMSADLVSLLYYLCFDDDAKIAEEAKSNIFDLPDSILLPVLSDPSTSGKILHFLGISLPERDTIIEAIALNKSTPDNVFAELGRNCQNERLIDIFANNQDRLIRYPKLIDELAANPLTPKFTVERMEQFYQIHTGRDYREDIGVPKEATPEPAVEADTAPVDEVPAVGPAAAEITEQVKEEILEDDAEDILGDDLPPNFTIDDILKQDMDVNQFFDEELLLDPEAELSQEKRDSLENQIRKMKVMEKMQLALKGNIEARNILMKSPNKMIQECVLNNPKISMDEVIRYAKNKTMREELIRIIATNREWAKNYMVRLNLVWNPKTPMTQSMKWLNTLNIKDLEKLSKSKQIPGMLAVTARKALQHKQRYQ